MENTADRAIAIVAAGAVLPDAPNVPAFWENVKNGRYSISEVSPDRWDPALYYDSDHSAPDKTYSKIGGWVREHVWDPMKWHIAIPPRVVDSLDDGQKWAISCTREALEDYGYPKRTLDLERTAVILGNSMAGERHYLTSLRIHFPEYAHELEESASFAALPQAMQRDIIREFHVRIGKRLPEITEDTMPGELSSCLAGRIANVFNFRGPNFVVDAACASTMAAVTSAAEGLIERDFDVAIAGGIDRNMGAPTFIKFCKIGALSATGIRPFAEGADGFVMGEGAVLLMLKRLADAERDGDNIYAVLRGIGGASDGKGKGITAPNPVGQKLSIERAWQNAGLSPATVTLIEGHGTSTPVGDVVEAQSLNEVLSGYQLPRGSVALGSVKSNIGHLKSAAGAVGLLKVSLALRDKILPPSVHCEHPNPDIDFDHSPLRVNTELKPWPVPSDGVRRAGVSAFGFGGTNFHAVLEEYIPHRLNGNGKRSIAVSAPPPAVGHKAPLRGALVIGAQSEAGLTERLRSVQKAAESGRSPAPSAPAESDLRAPERLAIDYSDAADLADKSAKALKALAANQPVVWKALRAQGIFRGHGPAPKVAFLYTGQGSQYVNMLKPLRALEPIVAQTFDEADRVMTPLLGKPLSDYIFVDQSDAGAVAKAEEDLRQTAITQPAVLAADIALTRLLAAYGIQPDMTMGHSLGEYGALIASGAIPFADALEAVSARGREMTRVSVEDNGKMAAVLAPLDEIERILKTIPGYVVIANINSDHQAVIGGASKTVEQASDVLRKAGYEVVPLPVSHAFHTSIVAPASDPLRQVLQRLGLESPRVPVVANVNGEFYPTGPDAVAQMVDILGRQIASPVQFVKGLRKLYDSGARVFVEVGPKKALQGFVDDVLGARDDVVALFTNHPKFGDTTAFNQALCGLYAAGLGASEASNPSRGREEAVPALATNVLPAPPELSSDRYAALGHLFADVLDRASQIYHGPNGASTSRPVTITGAALGLPGTEHIFDDSNIGRILRGEQLIDVIPARFRRAILDKHITRLVKSDNGGPTFETIDAVTDVIKLAGRAGAFDLEKEFGVSADRLPALDRVTQLAIAAGLDALRDAGIPLVMRYKTTSKGTELPDRWGLPDSLRDDTGVIFASAFPGYDSFAEEASRYYQDRARREQLAMLEDLRARVTATNGHSAIAQEIDNRIAELRSNGKEPYVLDRRFLFRILPMGHSQFAEFIGARGPNSHVNAACASTTQAVAVAEDWIRAGRCRRVIVVAADDITSDHLLEWMGAGFLASGAAATDEVVEEAALPFDRRRHGMIIGMGAAALVVESADAARERGISPICEVLSAVTANSAFHGTRLDVQHICQVMERLVREAEERSGVSRQQLARQMTFVSHETYTPARGGSAAAEIHALRQVFGDDADRIVITNTKGFTGHAMGAGLEDVVAVKALETGCVPPVANFKEVDPELGTLNLSKGAVYPIEYALRLGAGFGSQISMTLLHWVATKDGLRPSPNALGYSYRIADPAAWNAWLSQLAGNRAADLEVVHRTLRVRDAGSPARVPEVVQDFKPATTSVTPTSAPASDPVKERVLALVAEKTGYPLDMLALDLDLEADLGIDTVKQAEMFSAIRETYNIPRDENLKLRDFPTLAHVIRFASSKSSNGSAPLVEHVGQVANLRADSQSAPAEKSIEDQVLSIVTEKTGYPKDMLDLDLDLEADLGIDTVKQAEMFAAIREIYNIPRDENLKLRDFPTLAHVIRFASSKGPNRSAPAVEHVGQVANLRADSQSAPADKSIEDQVLSIVTEKTGYPKDMLDLDLDLEADLGIDTVKQAEMFAAIRELYNIPRDENLKLRDFPTLAHVIRFASSKQPQLAAATVAAPTPAAAANSIEDKVLAIVTEKTGYPKDMLDLDLDLEADLGIDTVKQAEMFAAIRELYNIPRDENLKLRDFPTLAHVIRFAQDRRMGSGAEPKPVARSAQPTLASLDAANSIPRRVPVSILRPPLSMCKPTGVTIGAGSRVIVMADRAGVAEALTDSLRSLGVEVLGIDDAPQADALASRILSWLAAGPVQGIYWLPALDNEGNLSDMDQATWREAMRVRVKSLYATMRILYEQIAPPGTFLVSATMLGGQHGYDDAGAVAPLGGAVTGFVKTYRRERLDAIVKAVDFAPGCTAAEIAEILVQETLSDSGALEIGYKGGLRFAVGLEEQPAANGQPGLDLNKDTVFLITGAAGSIVSAITADLASASGGTFYLLDLAPEPNPNDPDLARFMSDKEGLKRDLFARMQASGERATPARIEKELAALERAQAARSAIDAVRSAGGTAHYFAVNLTDADGVNKVIQQVRERSGRIDVLLHAAGMERSHLLRDKDAREFDLVFDVKIDGWFNLLHAIGDMPLAATVAFSSVAARFGNAGQADYSSANDLLCKIASSFHTTRPLTRGIAVDWTAWAGIGMASRGSIPKMMELAGIDMLPPEAGIPLIRRELTAGSTRGEIVIGQRLGILLNEWDATGGLGSAAAEVHGPMIGKLAAMGLHSGLAIETILDPSAQPFLHDHEIDGTPVLPGVMAVEAFGEAALSILPGWYVESVEDVNFQSPLKFYRHEPRMVTTEVIFHPQGDTIVADCRLTGRRTLPNHAEPQITTHFTGRVRLTKQRPVALTAPVPGTPVGSIKEAAGIYRVYFHGPSYRVLERAWADENRMVGQMAAGLPADHQPSGQPILMAPRLIELCFQTVGLWELDVRGRAGLPEYIHQVSICRAPELAEGRLYAVVTPDPHRNSFDARVVDSAGNVYVNLSGYRTVSLFSGVDAEPEKELHAAQV
jgi:acyl transferase domain-containing protein/NAD(P)-dependent dehydrogenase (short-subunit alcohol dehydrogenase family)/acyl carrier protein